MLNEDESIVVNIDVVLISFMTLQHVSVVFFHVFGVPLCAYMHHAKPCIFSFL